jgi:hypothetical protein
MTPVNDISTIFDADNHYWETSDAFTRYRDPKFKDRGVQLKEVDGQLRYYFGDRAHPIIPGPGDLHARPRPGALYEYFQGRSSKARVGNELACEAPGEHPEWFNRDARLRMDVPVARRLYGRSNAAGHRGCDRSPARLQSLA